ATHHAAHEAAAFALAAHRLHHVGHLAVHLQELVDLGGIGAGAGGDALFAAVLEDVGIGALGPRHRGDDGDLALEHPVVEAGGGELVLHAAHAGHHRHDAAHAA